jgi:molybdate transport repressor ModE-like protein
MDRFSLMQTFVRVAETGSVSAAARDLGLGQPAVSKHLQALEAAMNARLVQRSTQGIKLTEAGRRYYERAKRLIEDLRELDSDFADAHSDQLRGPSSPRSTRRLSWIWCCRNRTSIWSKPESISRLSQGV